MFKYFNQVGVDLIDMKGFLVFQHDSLLTYGRLVILPIIYHTDSQIKRKKDFS